MSTFLLAPASGQDPRERELHAVGIYEGAIKTGDTIHGGQAYVTVDRPGVDVSLFLSSYEPVTWFVSVEPHTYLEQVILGGYHTQAVTGISPEVNVIDAFYEGGTGQSFRAGYEINTARFRNAVREIAAMTGLGFSSFQGTYRYSHDSPFVINQVQDDPMLDPDYPFGTTLTELPGLSFQAVHFTPGSHPHQWNTSYGDFTLGGPIKDTLVELPRNIRQIAVDESRGQHYGLADHGIYEVDLESGTAEEMNVGMNVPRLSWTTGVAYDTQRDRLLVSTLGGEGFLYSYEPEATEWSVVTSLNNIDLYSLTYHEADDTIYGLAQPHGDTVQPVLHKYNAEGRRIGTITLDAPVLPGSMGMRSETQLISVGDYLVILKRPDDDPLSRTYLVDPDSGQTYLVEQDQPASLTAVATGNWHSVATWDDGLAIPSQSVQAVMQDHTATVVEDGAALSLKIDGAEAVVAVVPGRTLSVTADVNVAAGTLHVASSGRIEVGDDLLLGDGAQLLVELGRSAGVPVAVAGDVNLVNRDARGDGVADMALNSNSGNVRIDTDGNTINGYLITSGAHVFTGHPADNLPGVFQDDSDAMIGSQFLSPAFDGVHNLGNVIGPADLAGVHPNEDLAFTYTVQGAGGVFDGDLVVTNGNVLLLEATEFLGDLGSREWGEKTRTIITGQSIEGIFADEPAPGAHLGMGVFHQGVNYNQHAVTADLLQAAPGDTNGDRRVDGYDVRNVLAANKFATELPADWPEGDFTGDGLFNGDDVQAILATGLYGEHRYAAMAPVAVSDASLSLMITPDGLVIDADGIGINGYVLTSKAGVFTGESAQNLGLFQESNQRRISGNFAFTLADEHLLGNVIGAEFTAVDLGEDLSLSYTIEGLPGTFQGTLVVVPEPGTIALLAAGVLGLLLRRRRRAAP